MRLKQFQIGPKYQPPAQTQFQGARYWRLFRRSKTICPPSIIRRRKGRSDRKRSQLPSYLWRSDSTSNKARTVSYLNVIETQTLPWEMSKGRDTSISASGAEGFSSSPGDESRMRDGFLSLPRSRRFVRTQRLIRKWMCIKSSAMHRTFRVARRILLSGQEERLVHCRSTRGNPVRPVIMM
jgi:hypothetical protein